ncbi:MAG: uracil-DNA glycosylase [Gaiellales bacterium]|nr:uracil-DNA glycosylase [Gaiellales bacterium]
MSPGRAGTAGIGGTRSNSEPVPADELYERYLARAISEVNALGDEIARRGDAPARQPVLGSGHPLGDIFLLKHDPTPAELTEGVAFYGRVGQAVLKSVQRLDIDPLLVYGTNVVKLGGDHGRDERELAERVYPMWLLRELHIVQPKIVVIMGEDTLAVVNGLDLALAKPLEPELGVIQHLTPTIDALVTPPLEPSLDDAAAKRRFWAAFRALGEWHAALPPY